MKKVLLVTYYWPPAGGAGVQRILKFAKYLPQFGWQPVILTVKEPDCPVIDQTLLEDIPKNCIVYKSDALEPFNLYKKLTGKKDSYKIPSDVLTKSKNLSLIEKFSKWIRFNLFIPDAKLGWTYFALKEAKKIIKKENIDIVFSTAPPPTVARIGMKIAKKHNLKWVADFRDPWLEIVHYQNVRRSYLTRFIDSRFEKSVLKNANVLITISDDIKKLFFSKVGEKNYKIIPNGYDESDFSKYHKVKNQVFTMAYTGVITKTRIPHQFLKAFSKIVNEEGFNNIKFVIAGNTCPEFEDAVIQNKLSGHIEMRGFLPHHESTQILQSADLLLLMIDDVPQNKGFLTGKIFEYLGARIPIYAIGPLDGDANKILHESSSGKMVDYKDESGSYQLLKDMITSWKENSSDFGFNVEKYSRIKQTEQLSKVFEEQII